MIRLAGCLITWLVLAMSSAQGVPAQPRLEPPPGPTTKIDLRGTMWFGNEREFGPWNIIFEPDGTITYSYHEQTFRNGTWSIKGNIVYFETNQKFYEFRGELQGNAIQGESWNIRGERWHTWIQRGLGPK